MKTNKKDIISILLGNTLLALAVILFIVPGHLLSGGTTGISLFLNHYFHLPISIFTFIFNFIVFIIGTLILGKKFALQTLISTFYYPFILGVFEFSFQGFYLTDDILINTLFAGVLVGVAIAIVIKAGASTGGMDIPPLILNKLFKIPVSISMYVFDSLIVLAQFGFSDVRQCLYGIVLIFIYTMVIDKILVMGAQKIEVKIHGQTGYLLENTEVLINVISTRELVQVERIVKSIDEDAFMIISNVHEVQGRGFNLEKEYIEK
ncbi:MAG: YitT family protein [Coprobacillus sp.]|nr:YitT family protein [Coprobacillus sp.]